MHSMPQSFLLGQMKQGGQRDAITTSNDSFTQTMQRGMPSEMRKDHGEACRTTVCIGELPDGRNASDPHHLALMAGSVNVSTSTTSSPANCSNPSPMPASPVINPGVSMPLGMPQRGPACSIESSIHCAMRG